jgi:hypothetical protein
MPFTAFHLGAGLLGKGLAPKTQSLTFFAACQVAIDIEPGVRMLLDHDDLHTITHNPIGLAVVVTVCALVWRRLQAYGWWRLPVLSARALVDTAVWAALSHLILDAISHRDVWGSSVLYAGMNHAEDAALLMAGLGAILLGARWAIGAARARRLRRQTG